MRHSAHIGINVSARARRATIHHIQAQGRPARRSRKVAEHHGIVWHLFWTGLFVWFLFAEGVLPF